MLHSYGPERYLRHAVASVVTLRRHDERRPVALYCSEQHARHLRQHGLDALFAVVEVLPEAHRSITGFKHHLHCFRPFERSLFVDADMVWCRDPDPLWTQLSVYPFTATGTERADFWFGGPKGLGIIPEVLLDRRRRTLRRFGLTHLPRVQAGMIYTADAGLTQATCTLARQLLDRREETHFRSRLDEEGRSEETCEWSLAMAMSRMKLPVFPWRQGYDSPQLDFIEELTDYDLDFCRVTCRYYCDPLVHSLRGLPSSTARAWLTHVLTRLPGRGDHLEVTPFALHFGWLHHKQPFHDFSLRTWDRLTRRARPVRSLLSS